MKQIISTLALYWLFATNAFCQWAECGFDITTDPYFELEDHQSI